MEAKNSEPVTGIRENTQPHSFHDLLDQSIKNPSFVVRFDVQIPRPRFLIVHRAVVRNYCELTLVDRREMLRVALSFTKRHNLYNCSLTIPLGKMRPQQANNCFFAHLLVPDQKKFLHIYDALHNEIPQWEDHRWRTEHWPKQSDPSEWVADTYRRGLRIFARQGTSVPEVQLAVTSSEMPKLSRRGSCYNTGFISPNDRTLDSDYRFVCHSSLPLVAMLYIGESNFSGDIPVECRWELLDAMHDFVQEHCDLSATGCHISISLAKPYNFDKEENVVGFIRFPKEIPESVLNHVRANIPEATRNVPEVSVVECQSCNSSENAPHKKIVNRLRSNSSALLDVIAVNIISEKYSVGSADGRSGKIESQTRFHDRMKKEALKGQKFRTLAHQSPKDRSDSPDGHAASGQRSRRASAAAAVRIDPLQIYNSNKSRKEMNEHRRLSEQSTSTGNKHSNAEKRGRSCQNSIM